MSFKIYTDFLGVDSFKFISRIFCTLTCAKEKEGSKSKCCSGRTRDKKRI
jgi:hypothetical protein